MAVREICLLGNPVLRMRSKRIGRTVGEEERRTVEDLRDTLENFRKTHGFGRGIAAPQIGIAKRIIFVDLHRPLLVSRLRTLRSIHRTDRLETSVEGFPLINPEVVWRSHRTMVLWDDCFSFRDLLVRVRRSVRIAVRFRDVEGQTLRLNAEGDLSELLQHEIDHINGILALDRAVNPKEIFYRSEWERLAKNTMKSRLL